VGSRAVDPTPEVIDDWGPDALVLRQRHRLWIAAHNDRLIDEIAPRAVSMLFRFTIEGGHAYSLMTRAGMTPKQRQQLLAHVQDLLEDPEPYAWTWRDVRQDPGTAYTTIYRASDLPARQEDAAAEEVAHG
jgi:hypothetical protein